MFTARALRNSTPGCRGRPADSAGRVAPVRASCARGAIVLDEPVSPETSDRNERPNRSPPRARPLLEQCGHELASSCPRLLSRTTLLEDHLPRGALHGTGPSDSGKKVVTGSRLLPTFHASGSARGAARARPHRTPREECQEQPVRSSRQRTPNGSRELRPGPIRSITRSRERRWPPGGGGLRGPKQAGIWTPRASKPAECSSLTHKQKAPRRIRGERLAQEAADEHVRRRRRVRTRPR